LARLRIAQLLVTLAHADQRFRRHGMIAAVGELLILLDRAFQVSIYGFCFDGRLERHLRLIVLRLARQVPGGEGRAEQPGQKNQLY
jgi:hypothetical protein